MPWREKSTLFLWRISALLTDSLATVTSIFLLLFAKQKTENVKRQALIVLLNAFIKAAGPGESARVETLNGEQPVVTRESLGSPESLHWEFYGNKARTFVCKWML